MRAVFALLLLSIASASFGSTLSEHIDAIAATLPPQTRHALQLIQDEKRRWLALAYYVRAGNTLPQRWSWTRAQIEAYEGSKEHQLALEEIDRVAQQFAKNNPGYALYANTRVRSLEEQTERWSQVASIGIAAAELHRKTNHWISRKPAAELVAEIQKFMRTWRPSKPPTLAAPGLSLHGRGRAFDFQIRDVTGRTVAGTDSSSIARVWDGQGWADKLERAVRAASHKFVGPLKTPREPWHYEYVP